MNFLASSPGAISCSCAKQLLEEFIAGTRRASKPVKVASDYNLSEQGSSL
jgi:hypothetical protein